MLHNLLIIEKLTGISIGNINLSGKDYTEKEIDFLSASIKAIQGFFKEMDFGELETFQFLEKTIMIHTKNSIVMLLICDKDTSNLPQYYPKLELISVMFEKSIEWFSWDGNVSKFQKLLDAAKEILLDS